jgi:hypothetical protein
MVITLNSITYELESFKQKERLLPLLWPDQISFGQRSGPYFVATDGDFERCFVVNQIESLVFNSRSQKVEI